MIHGNLKPDNILISQKNDGTFEAWATEFALSKMVSFRPLNEDPSDGTVFLSQSMQFQESLKESQAYRPVAAGAGDLAEEQWDINALGGLVRYVTQKSQNSQGIGYIGKNGLKKHWVILLQLFPNHWKQFLGLRTWLPMASGVKIPSRDRA